MATISTFNPSVLDSILPPYGQHRVQQPIWDESRKMFIADEHESQAGNRSYKGVRVSDRFVIVEQIGNYHNWTYLNSVEMYVFDGKDRTLIGKKEFPKTFYNADLVRQTSEEMLMGYLKSQLQMQHQVVPDSQLLPTVKEFVSRSYCSLLDDKSQRLLEMAMPLLE